MRVNRTFAGAGTADERAASAPCDEFVGPAKGGASESRGEDGAIESTASAGTFQLILRMDFSGTEGDDLSHER